MYRNTYIKGVPPSMELNFKAIGKRIKIARLKTDLTQEIMAEKIGVTPQHVSNIKTGNSSVSLTTLIAIANLLDRKSVV